MKLLLKVVPALITAFALLLPGPAAAKTKASRIVLQVRESGTQDLSATWTWNKKKTRFVGRWSNGSAGYLRVQRWDREQIILTRFDAKGATARLKARYEGIPQGNAIEGTVVYRYLGQVTRGTWRASRLGAPLQKPRPSALVRRRPLNTRNYPGERRVLLSATERKSFPRLRGNFEILAPRTKAYNCIAWSIGRNDHWAWPGNTLTAFDQLYAQYGFRRMPDKDYRLVPGVQKIVLYARVGKNGRLKCTHGARQEPDGSWTSKLGKLPLIRHRTPDDLIGPSYGRPFAVYVKS